MSVRGNTTVMANRIFKTRRLMTMVTTLSLMAILIIVSFSAHSHIKSNNPELYEQNSQKLKNVLESVTNKFYSDKTDYEMEEEAEAEEAEQAQKEAQDKQSGQPGQSGKELADAAAGEVKGQQGTDKDEEQNQNQATNPDEKKEQAADDSESRNGVFLI